MTRGRQLLLGGFALAVIAVGVFGARRFTQRDSIVATGDTTSAPQGQRVLVEVLNASGVAGLARRATFLIRDRGFDVVTYGTDPGGRRSGTVVVDYSNKPEAAERMARVLGGAQVERGRDSLDRGLDLTVKLGTSYRPPADAFHP
ncbi:MAG: LytR C-terminal domain-containing protein [Gemmatimonadaceae bacterium]|nr:LytR C-terminal domain-containing protein [Gemmatimonadaceae bacterium]